jgi:inner membrane protein
MVSPISVGAFFGKWGLTVIKSELFWVWLPSFSMVVVSTVIRVVAVRH